MPADLSPRRPPPVAAVTLFLLACVLYAIVLVAIVGLNEQDPMAGGAEDARAGSLLGLFALFFGVLLWVVLGVLLAIGVFRGQMQRKAKLIAGILYPLSGLAVSAAIVLCARYPGGWLILVPAVLPPLIALYAMWARFPTLQTVLPSDLTRAALLSAMSVVIVALLPLAYLDRLQAPARAAQRNSRGERLAARNAAAFAKLQHDQEARFERLGPDSRLREYLGYLNSSDDAQFRQALAGARLVKTRQNDAVTLLEQGEIDALRELWQLDLEATPELCKAFDAALHSEAASPEGNVNAGERLELQLPNMQWLVAERCDLDGGMAAAETRVQAITSVMGPQDGARRRWDRFLAILSELRQTR